jgi:hypothetical protein
MAEVDTITAITDPSKGVAAPALIVAPDKEKPTGRLDRYRTEEWLMVLKLMDKMDSEGLRSDHPLLRQVNFCDYNIPTQHERHPFPNEDNSLSDHQRFYLEAVSWVERLADEIDLDRLLNFPPSFEGLDKLDPEMHQAVNDVAKLLTQRAESDDTRLRFTLTTENYQKLDTPLKKIAAFLLLRARLSTRVARARRILMMGAEEMGISSWDGKSLVDFYNQLVERGYQFRLPDQDYFSSPIGSQRTIEWLDELYQHPLFTSIYHPGQFPNRVRADFIEDARVNLERRAREERLKSPQNLRDRTEGQLEAARLDQALISKTEKGHFRLSAEGRAKAAQFFKSELEEGSSPEEITVLIQALRQEAEKAKIGFTVQEDLFLKSLFLRARRESEKEARQKIKAALDRLEQMKVLGKVSLFERNSLMEKILANRRRLNKPVQPPGRAEKGGGVSKEEDQERRGRMADLAAEIFRQLRLDANRGRQGGPGGPSSSGAESGSGGL